MAMLTVCSAKIRTKRATIASEISLKLGMGRRELCVNRVEENRSDPAFNFGGVCCLHSIYRGYLYLKDVSGYVFR
jgi:hypothetical protein